MKNKKYMFIMAIILIVLIILVAIQSGIIWNMSQEKNKSNNKEKLQNENKITYTETEDSKKFKQEYEELNNIERKEGETYISVNIPTENPIIYVTPEELLNLINSDEQAYIFISGANSPFSRAIIEPLLNVLQELEIEKLYYLDTTNGITFKDDAQKQEIMNNLTEKEILTQNEEGKQVWNIPLIAKTQSGEILLKDTGINITYGEGQSYYSELTEEQKQELYDHYYELLKK